MSLELSGRRVLILEDEAMVSLLLEDMIEDLGGEVAGAFCRVAHALEAVEAGAAVDVAILDVNVAGERSFPVAAALAERNVPFVFATGYDESGLPEVWRNRPALRKPFHEEQVTAALAAALGLVSPSAPA